MQEAPAGIDTTCSNCGAKATVSARWVGKRVRCRRCQKAIRIKGPARARSLTKRARCLRWSRTDMAAAAFVGLLLLATMLVRPVIGSYDPVLAVRGTLAAQEQYWEAQRGVYYSSAPISQRVDPWGTPYKIVFEWQDTEFETRIESALFYSAGPDGFDDKGAGDDIPIIRDRTRLLAQQRSDVWVGEARAILGALTVAVAMAYFVPRRLPAFKTSAAEAVTVALCGAVPAGLLAAGASAIRLPMDLLQDVPMLIVPVPVALLGTAGALCTLAALGGRVVVRARAARS